MKALYFEKHGGIEDLKFGDRPTPVPAPGEIKLRVRACALNHLDLWVLKGWPGLKLSLPHIGGADIAGEVEECGTEVRSVSKGDRVALIPGFIPENYSDEFVAKGEDSLSPQYRIFGEQLPGGLAEFVLAPSHTVLRIPAQLSFAEAAAPLLVATTAWRMLKHRAQLQTNQSVLVVGAGGGLNSFTITLARDLGAKVIALTSSQEKEKHAKALGAEITLNYKTFPNWGREVRQLAGKEGVDVVIDNVGLTFEQSLLALKRGGKLITVGNTTGPYVQFDNRLVFAKQLSILGSTMGSMSDAREAISYAWRKGPRVWIDREIPLAQGAEAYAILERGEQSGKIVLTP